MLIINSFVLFHKSLVIRDLSISLGKEVTKDYSFLPLNYHLFQGLTGLLKNPFP